VAREQGRRLLLLVRWAAVLVPAQGFALGQPPTGGLDVLDGLLCGMAETHVQLVAC
jgi:hypothetical protein